jgi:serine/threonine-protein kinase RsbW
MGAGITISLRHDGSEQSDVDLQPLQAATHRFAADERLDAVMSARLAIVVEELACNVIDHGAQGREVWLRVSLANDAHGLIVAIEDDGAPFDPREATLPDRPNGERGGGAGLALVRAWADIVDYRRDGQTNRLVLRLRPREDID